MSASTLSRRRSTITTEIFRDLLNGVDTEEHTEMEKSNRAKLEWQAQLPHMLVITILSVWFVVFVLLVIHAHIPHHISASSGLVGLAIVTLAALKSVCKTSNNKTTETGIGSGLYLEHMARTSQEAEQCKRQLDKLLGNLHIFDEHFRWLFRSGILRPGTDEFGSWRVSTTRYKALRRY